MWRSGMGGAAEGPWAFTRSQSHDDPSDFEFLRQCYQDTSGVWIILEVFDICVRYGQCATRACANRFDVTLAINSTICRETMLEYKRREFSGMNPPWIYYPGVMGMRRHYFIESWLDVFLNPVRILPVSGRHFMLHRFKTSWGYDWIVGQSI